MDKEILEYLKFLHLHGLVDIITIIDSIPIYYQTQMKSFKPKNHHDLVFHQKMRLQALTFIAKQGFCFSFPTFRFDFQTYRVGPFSLDIENELLNLINSEIFNNAVSTRKDTSKRYPINAYNKEELIEMFKGESNYRTFLEISENKDLYTLRDIGLVIEFHNLYTNHGNVDTRKLYGKSDINKYKLLYSSLKDIVTFKINSHTYIKNLIDMVFFSLQKGQNLQNLSFYHF